MDADEGQDVDKAAHFDDRNEVDFDNSKDSGQQVNLDDDNFEDDVQEGDDNKAENQVRLYHKCLDRIRLT